jgi:hypothetical protein
MQVEANLISRDWTIRHEGRTFYVNYTESDTHTLALCNRDNWEVLEETEDGTEELNVYGCGDDTAEERKVIQENFELMKRLIRFCIANWENGFMRQLKDDLHEQRQSLESL